MRTPVCLLYVGLRAINRSLCANTCPYANLRASCAGPYRTVSRETSSSPIPRARAEVTCSGRDDLSTTRSAR